MLRRYVNGGGDDDGVFICFHVYAIYMNKHDTRVCICAGFTQLNHCCAVCFHHKENVYGMCGTHSRRSWIVYVPTTTQ